jgi:hypothetical protein
LVGWLISCLFVYRVFIYQRIWATATTQAEEDESMDGGEGDVYDSDDELLAEIEATAKAKKGLRSEASGEVRTDAQLYQDDKQQEGGEGTVEDGEAKKKPIINRKKEKMEVKVENVRASEGTDGNYSAVIA